MTNGQTGDKQVGGKSILNRSITEAITDALNSSKVMDSVADGLAEKQFEQSIKDVVTLEECLDACKKAKSKYPNVGGMILSVRKNPNPKNDKDELIVMIGLLDENSKPLSNDGANALVHVIHTKTIDDKLIKFLGGDDKKICMFK